MQVLKFIGKVIITPLAILLVVGVIGGIIAGPQSFTEENSTMLTIALLAGIGWVIWFIWFRKQRRE